MDLSIEGWPERMRMRGHSVTTEEFPGSPKFGCIMVTKDGRGHFVGFSDDSMADAIKNCQDRFGLSNIMIAMDAGDDRAKQRANKKEVKRILGI